MIQKGLMHTHLGKFILLFVVGSVLFLNGCSKHISPPIPPGTLWTPNITYRLPRSSSMFSEETRKYLEAKYSHMLTNDPKAPTMAITVSCVDRQTPGFGGIFGSACALGFPSRHYEVMEQCNIKIISPDMKIVYETSANGRASLSSWGYFALFGDVYSSNSWAIVPTERRAELIAVNSALQQVINSENQIALKLRGESSGGE